MPTVTVGSPVFFVNEGPSPALPRGREFLANALDTAGKSPLPLGRVGEGLSIGRCASPATIIGGS